jgi:hypothetical protein
MACGTSRSVRLLGREVTCPSRTFSHGVDEDRGVDLSAVTSRKPISLHAPRAVIHQPAADARPGNPGQRLSASRTRWTIISSRAQAASGCSRAKGRNTHETNSRQRNFVSAVIFAERWERSIKAISP